jgi:hypothetical protein
MKLDRGLDSRTFLSASTMTNAVWFGISSHFLTQPRWGSNIEYVVLNCRNLTIVRPFSLKARIQEK